MQVSTEVKTHIKEVLNLAQRMSDGKEFTRDQRALIQEIEDREKELAATTWVRTQSELANALGITTKTVQNKQHDLGAPKKTRRGFSVEAWQAFLSRGSGSEQVNLLKYAEMIDLSTLKVGSAENHRILENATARYAQMFEFAELANDIENAVVIKKIWMDFSEHLKKFEDLTRKHQLDIGETVTADQALKCISAVYMALARAYQLAQDQICKVKVTVTNPAELRQQTAEIFIQSARVEMQALARAKMLPEQLRDRVLDIFGQNRPELKTKTPRKTTPKKKRTKAKTAPKKKRTPRKASK
jgi:hypothetical protein